MGRKRLDEVEVTGVLATRRRADGRRHIKLRKSERTELANQRLVEAAVAMFLDLEHDRSWEEIARELGVSIMKLKDITKSKEFMEAYDLHYADLGHDPRLKATQAAISDMLPMAMRQLRSLITAQDTPASTRLNAIRDVLRLAGVQEATPAKSDRGELTEFLKDMGVKDLTVNNTQVNVALPQDFKEQVDQFLDVDPKDVKEVAE